MALQSSGIISLADIQAEFGGSNPIGTNEYYGADTGVPSSGIISLSDFYGTSAVPPAPTYTISVGSVYDSGTSTYRYGFDTVNNTYGSISPGTFLGNTIIAANSYVASNKSFRVATLGAGLDGVHVRVVIGGQTLEGTFAYSTQIAPYGCYVYWMNNAAYDYVAAHNGTTCTFTLAAI